MVQIFANIKVDDPLKLNYVPAHTHTYIHTHPNLCSRVYKHKRPVYLFHWHPHINAPTHRYPGTPKRNIYTYKSTIVAKNYAREYFYAHIHIYIYTLLFLQFVSVWSVVSYRFAECTVRHGMPVI